MDNIIVLNELDKLCKLRMYETLCFRMISDSVNKWTILKYDFTSTSKVV